MSTYVLMRILESAPRRYDLGMRLVTLGRLERAYDRLASHVGAGQQVLDLGCGTGALALRAARRGARVKAVDVEPRMLEIARGRAREAGLEEALELVEMGVAELGGEASARYDAVSCGLCLSELSPDERRFTLRQVARLLRPGGLLLVADEVRPRSRAARWTWRVLRAPLVALTWLVTQQTTHPLARLPETLGEAGFEQVSLRASALGSFCEIVARKPPRTGP
jgi:demethylmenaquinone methyltransferase/2-methoxy-6-polyprenyl-1,4-benzoquinol methylase